MIIRKTDSELEKNAAQRMMRFHKILHALGVAMVGKASRPGIWKWGGFVMKMIAERWL